MSDELFVCACFPGSETTYWTCSCRGKTVCDVGGPSHVFALATLTHTHRHRGTHTWVMCLSSYVYLLIWVFSFKPKCQMFCLICRSDDVIGSHRLYLHQLIMHRALLFETMHSAPVCSHVKCLDFLFVLVNQGDGNLRGGFCYFKLTHCVYSQNSDSGISQRSGNAVVAFLYQQKSQ